MDRNFAKSLALVLRSEGGWSDNPLDNGGATMKGITLATFRTYIMPGGSKADLRAITDEQLSTCYRKEYWDKVAGDDLPDGVDYAVFDFAVNSGPSRAAHYLQSVVGATMDGAIGPDTLAAIAKMPAGVVIDRLCDARLAFLQSLGTWHTFGIGWSARVASVRKNALLMTAQGTLPQSQQIGATPATGPVISVPNNLPGTSGPLAVPQVSIPAPSAPPKAPAAPVPAKPVVKPPAIHPNIKVSIVMLLAAPIIGFWHHIVHFAEGLLSWIP